MPKRLLPVYFSATAETKASREFSQMRKSVQASTAAIEAGKA